MWNPLKQWQRRILLYAKLIRPDINTQTVRLQIVPDGLQIFTTHKMPEIRFSAWNSPWEERFVHEKEDIHLERYEIAYEDTLLTFSVGVSKDGTLVVCTPPQAVDMGRKPWHLRIERYPKRKIPVLNVAQNIEQINFKSARQIANELKGEE